MDGNLLYLSTLNQLHIQSIYQYLNDKRITATYPVSIPFTRVDLERYYEREIEGRKHGERFAFAIEIKHRFMGVCALYNVNQLAASAKLYYWVGVEFWNGGIGSNAIKKLIHYARHTLRLNELECGVLERNKASLRILEKNGFSLACELTNEGQYHDKFLGETFVEMKLDLAN